MSPKENAEQENKNFAALFNESIEGTMEFREGEVVSGKILKVNKDYVLVDIGFKSEGFIPIDEFKDSEGNCEVEVGDTVDVLIETYENDDGLVILSKEKADRAKLWDEVALACERGELVQGKIVNKVKGGLSVDIGIKAFLPGSQIDLSPVRDMDNLIGKVFQFKIIKFNKKRGNIVLSRRVLLEKEREALRGKTLEVLEEGKVMKGTVKNITDYGAFVDLGGIDGLLHITDMSWKRIGHPSEMVKIGDEIEVKILKYDRERERVSLGVKQITEDPWKGVEERYPVDARVKGKVVSLTDYGAFIEIEEGVEGLIHISEMSWTKRIKHPSQVLKVGDEVEAVILDNDPSNRKIALGMKQIEPNPWALLEERYPKGTHIKGVIKNVTDFGIFVGIDEGIDGLIHVSDVSWSQKVKDPSEMFNKGDEIEAVVLHIDPENERFSLGIKQLTTDPWESLASRFPPGSEIEGEVIKITDFGIFVKLEEGIEGLVHVSEIDEARVEDPRQYANVGDKVKVMILNIDPHEKRVSLSMKELKKQEEHRDYKKYQDRSQSPGSTLGDLMPDSLLKRPSPEEEKVEAEAVTSEETEATTDTDTDPTEEERDTTEADKN